MGKFVHGRRGSISGNPRIYPVNGRSDSRRGAKHAKRRTYKGRPFIGVVTASRTSFLQKRLGLRALRLCAKFIAIFRVYRPPLTSNRPLAVAVRFVASSVQWPGRNFQSARPFWLGISG